MVSRGGRFRLSFESEENEVSDWVPPFKLKAKHCYYLGREFRFKEPADRFIYLNEESDYHNWTIFITKISTETDKSTKENPVWSTPKVYFKNTDKKKSLLGNKDIHKIFTIITEPFATRENKKWKTLTVTLINIETIDEEPMSDNVKSQLAFRS